jgi:DNA-binding response OmpR family regulator
MPRIGVISDTHGLVRPEALRALAGAELIVHAGDVGAPEVLDALRAVHPSVPVVMLTGQTSEEGAIEAFRRGASDYVVKGEAYIEALASRARGLVAA